MERIYQRYFSLHENKKIMCVARNYKAYIQAGEAVPTTPSFFDKPYASMLVDGKPLLLSKHQTEIFHEVELGLVIGMTGRNIKAQDWHKHIAGYFVGLDFVNRALLAKARADGSSWCLAKGGDGFAAVSDFICKSEVQDCNNLQLKLLINGEVRQDASTDGMIIKVPQLVEYLSKHMTLNEGDLIFTGTPAGAGPVHVGDVLKASLSTHEGKHLVGLEFKVEPKH